MQKDKTQLLRLVFIDKKIREGMRTGKLANCTSIAKEYEVSAKSILRDIDYLKNQRDAPIEYSPSRFGYFYTEENYQLPAFEINASDLFAICIAEKVLRQHQSTPIYGKLLSVFKKIEESLPEKVSIQPSWINAGFSIINDQQTTIDPDIWATVSNGLQEAKTIEISYQKPTSSDSSARMVDPYHIVSYRGEWYMIGYCHKRLRVLTFAVSRIRKASVSKKSFKIQKDFNYRETAEQKFGIFGGNQIFTVKILFDKQTSPYIEERNWHPSQQLTKDKKGLVTLTVETSHLLEIKRWVLSWGRGAQVLEPANLRNEIGAELENTLKQYRSETI